MTSPSAESDLADALLEPYGLPAERRRAVRARALAAARRIESLAAGLTLGDEPSAYVAALRREAASRTR